MQSEEAKVSFSMGKKILILTLTLLFISVLLIAGYYHIYVKDENLSGDFVICQKKTFKDTDAFIPCESDGDCSFDSMKKYCDPFQIYSSLQCPISCGSNKFCEQDCFKKL